ncbi:integrase, catalytic region, zinc finger, CCHC-type containing protein [Tanacetum coccineum]
MRVLSVISVKVFEKYGYNYLREINLRQTDYQEYKISEKDFKNLHPNGFEDLFLLNIQEKLNHLPKTDKISLFTSAVNPMWIKKPVQTNTSKKDYTIVPKQEHLSTQTEIDLRKQMRLHELHHKHPSETIVFHNEDGNPARANIKQALESDKTCKKRITPTSITEGERGFEQTKTCYLTEVIPFFKTIKEHFKGIQTALIKEIKEMQEVFDQMEAEVDQHAVDKKCDEIERKNLLIENENIIADCLSKYVLYSATNFVLMVSRFSDMHDAYIAAQKRIAKLKAKNSNLKNKIQNDDHDEMIKHFSKLEVEHLNLQLKYQHLKERFGNKNQELKAKISRLQKKHSEADPIFDFKALDSQNKDLNAKVNALQDLNEHFRVQIKGKTKCITMLDPMKPKVLAPGTLREIIEEARVEKPLDNSLASACLYTKHSQELLEYVIGTCLKDFNKRDRKITTTPLNRKKQVTFMEPGVKDATAASGSKPRSNTKKDRTLPAKSDMKKVEAHSRNNKSSVKQKNRVDSSISFKRTVVQIVLWYLDSGCSKHMTGDRSRLRNFVKKFIGTVRFGNDHFGAIMGYGDYVIGDSVISRVYYVEGLGHNLFSVRQFCDSDLEVAFRKHSCYVRDVNGVDLIKGNRGTNLYTISVEDMMKSSPICLLSKASKNKSWLWHRRLNHLNFVLTEYYESVGIFHQKSVLRTPQQNDIVERRNRTFVEAARTMLIFSKAQMVLWAEAVATACYIQDRSLIHTRHNKTPYELVHDNKPDLRFLRVFGALCYPTNDSEDLRKLRPTADIGIFVGVAPNRKGYRIYNKRTQRIMEIIHIQFDELTEPMAHVHISTGLEPILLMPGQISSGLVPDPVLAAPYVPPTNKDLNILFQPICTTLSTSYSPLSSVVQPLITHQGVAAGPTIKDNPFAQTDNDPFVNVFAPEPSSDESSSRDVNSVKSTQVVQQHTHLGKWSKDHPLDNVIVEPKNVKTAMDEACWFKAMQEEIYKFDRLQVWELVPKPDCVMIIALKWIYKVNLDKYCDVLKNKAHSLQLVDKPDKEQAKPEPEPQGAGEEYDVEQAIQMSLKSFQAQGADTNKTNSEGDTKILNIGGEQGEDVANKEDLKGKTAEIDEGQAGSDPGKTPESQPPPEYVRMEEDQAGPNPGLSHMALAGPDPEPMHDDFVAIVYPQVHVSLKHLDEEHVHVENPLSSTKTLSSMKNLDAYTYGDYYNNNRNNNNNTSTTSTTTKHNRFFVSLRVLTLEQRCADLEKKHKLQDKTTQALSSRIFTLELRDLPYKINQTVHEAVKEAVHVALQAPLRDRFRELPEADMKEILHQWMFESGTYKSLPEHVALYEALEAYRERANRDEFLAKKDKSRKRRYDDQDPHPPPDSYLRKKNRHDTGTSSSKQPPTPQSSTWKTSDTREAPCSSSKQKSIKTRPEWLKPISEEDRPLTPKPDWVIPPIDLPETENNGAIALVSSYQYPDEYKLLRQTGDMSSFINWFCKRIGKKKLSKADLEVDLVNPEGHRVVSDMSKPLTLGGPPDFGLEELVPSLWIESERDYDTSATYGISHWWFKRKEFYITRYSAPSDHSAVRSHMRILSVVSLKTYERYRYTFLKEIVLRRADYNEYKISEADFKNLHPNNFEDMYLLHLQEDYTIVSKPRAVIYRDRNDQKKMMRETEVHKFSDGTLNRILDKLDHMVKDFKLFKYNLGMETRIWSEDDKRRSKEFMEVIERRLKIRRIFRSLESFVGGRLRDVDYRLIQRTE